MRIAARKYRSRIPKRLKDLARRPTSDRFG
jgi:hypothetical protein